MRGLDALPGDDRRFLGRGHVAGHESILDEAPRFIAAAISNAPVRPETSEAAASLPYFNRSQPIVGCASVCIRLEHDDFAGTPEGWIGVVGAVDGGKGIGQYIRPGDRLHVRYLRTDH